VRELVKFTMNRARACVENSATGHYRFRVGNFRREQSFPKEAVKNVRTPRSIGPILRFTATMPFALFSLFVPAGAAAEGAPSWTDVPGVVRPVAQIYPMPNDNAIGDPKAPVRIDEYGDFQCHYCRQFALDVEPQIVDRYVATGKVYLVFHSMGNFLSDFSKTPDTESQDAAMAAYAAGEQNRFWDYHDVLYANQKPADTGYLTRAQLRLFAQAVGLDMKRFDTSLDSGKYARRVEDDRTQGELKGITGIPVFFINSQEIIGAKPFSDFQKAIDDALAANR